MTRATLTIDRALFVSLTFAMAGVACATGRGAEVGVIDIPKQPAQPADAGAVPTPEKPVVVAKAAEPEDDGDPEDETDPGFATAEGGLAVAHGPGCGWVDPKTIPKPAAKCSDDQGTVSACTMMKSCSGFTFPKQKCEAYRKYFKPKVAQKALDCLGKLSATQACDACNAYKCGDLAMKSACPDTSADATCAQVTAKCKALSMNECKTYFSGLNGQGRTKLAGCLTSGSGCSFGIFSCAEGLF